MTSARGLVQRWIQEHVVWSPVLQLEAERPVDSVNRFGAASGFDLFHPRPAFQTQSSSRFSILT